MIILKYSQYIYIYIIYIIYIYYIYSLSIVYWLQSIVSLGFFIDFFWTQKYWFHWKVSVWFFLSALLIFWIEYYIDFSLIFLLIFTLIFLLKILIFSFENIDFLVDGKWAGFQSCFHECTWISLVPLQLFVAQTRLFNCQVLQATPFGKGGLLPLPPKRCPC